MNKYGYWEVTQKMRKRTTGKIEMFGKKEHMNWEKKWKERERQGETTECDTDLD